jgi:hypothetical protein
MPRRILLTTALIVLSANFGLGQSASQPGSDVPTGPFGGPILVTPTATFSTPPPTAGISDAGRAGFSSLGTNYAAPGESGMQPAGAATTAVEPGVASPPTSTQQMPINDLAPSSSLSNASELGASGAISVAEAAARYKANQATRHSRVLSNGDAQTMLNNKSGVTMAKNMPPLGPGALEQSGQSQVASTPGASQGGAAQSSPQNTQAGTTTNQRIAGQGGTPPPATATQGQSAVPSTSADNATTPQINQNQQRNDAQGSRRLPATASLLPLLGLLGLASGGLGLWFRRFGK